MRSPCRRLPIGDRCGVPRLRVRGGRDDPNPSTRLRAEVSVNSLQASWVKALVNGSTLTDRLRRDLDLLHRHITVLKAVEEHQPVGIMRLSKRLGVPQHKVRYALRVLEQDGLLRPSRAGAIATKKAKPFHNELHDVLTAMKETVETLTNSL